MRLNVQPRPLSREDLWQRRWDVLNELGAMKSFDYGSSREQGLVEEARYIDAKLEAWGEFDH